MILKKKITIVIIPLVLIASGYFYFTKEKKSEYNYVVAEKGDVIQEVNVTGKVESSENVDLAFEKSGKIVFINTDVGKKVSTGQILARIDSSELSAQLAQAEADVKAQQAKLDELKRGTRPEEIKLQEIKVNNAKETLIDDIQNSYTKSDDAIRNKVDQLFSNPNSSDPKINIIGIDSQLKIDIENGRFLIKVILDTWKISLNDLTSLSDLDVYIKEAKDSLDKVKSLLDKVASAVNSLTSNSSLTQATIDSYKSDISTARTNINTVISSVSSSENDLRVEENQLSLLIVGTIKDQINAQEAQVEKSEASVKNIMAQINKTILYSPINGVVTKQDAKVGEIIVANSNIISVISISNYEIKSDVPEADIAKVKVGDKVRLTLDAYGDEVEFSATVVKIDPAETVIEGVSNYMVTFNFDEKDERVRSGMTANLDIMTDKRENVLIVPLRAIIAKNGNKIVRVLKGDPSIGPVEIEEREVKTGLRGSYGNVEILEGLSEGEKVVTFIKE